MINEEQIRELAAKVIGRLVQRLGGPGKKGDLVVVFTAASVGFTEAIQQVQGLILDGFRIRLAFSQAAESLLSGAVREQLRGFPNVSPVEPASWLSSLRVSSAVLVPLLSLNTLSKLSMLIADNVATNIILHGLLMGKPVVLAQNGADPADKGREVLGFHKCNPALRQAMAERMKTIEHYGCILTDIRELGDTVKSALAGKRIVEARKNEIASPVAGQNMRIAGRFVTAADVLHAWRTGVRLSAGSASGITSLARDLAVRHGVVFTQD